MDLDSERFDVVGSVSSSGEVREVELDLIPALVQSHGHGTDEGLDSGSGLVVGGSESSPDALVVQNLHFEGEVLLQVFDDHDQERQLDGQGLLWVEGSVDVVGGHVGSHDLEDRRLDVWVGDSLDVTVSHLLVPNLEGLGSTLRLMTCPREGARSEGRRREAVLTQWSRGWRGIHSDRLS